MKIRITRTVHLHQSVVKNTLELLTPFNGPMKFMEESKPVMFRKDGFTWEEFFRECTTYRHANNINESDFLVVLTELRNDSNWFSSFSESGERTVFIHASEWESYIYCEPVFPIAYEVIANVFQCLSFGKYKEELMGFIHNEPIGCMNDMCGWKLDISFKLRTADICQECLKIFAEVSNEEQLKQGIDIIEGLRKKMLF